MRRIVRYLVRLTLPVLALAGAGTEPAAAQDRPATRDELLDVARQIMVAARFATLVTVDSAGQPQARIMDPFAPDSQMVIWIGTNPRSRKVAQLQKDDRVALSYFDAASMAYVTITGRAELVDDAAEKAQRFKSEWAPLYPDRARDYVLLKVIPQGLELISERAGVGFADPVFWRPPALKFGAGTVR